MSPRYVLGLNKYDHDVAAVLLRDGVPVVGICKERITREKHASGPPDAAVGYCLKAAGIGLSDLDLIVQNCYALVVPELERDLLGSFHSIYMSRRDREIALRSPLFRNPDAVTVSHHIAHAYSAFAASPFDDGAVMIVDGVGSHRRDVTEALPEEDTGADTDRESESYYVFRGTEIECVGKAWLTSVPGTLSEVFTRFAGLGAMYSRVSEYVFGHWNKCGEVMGLAAYGGPRDDLPPLMGVRDGRTWVAGQLPEHLCHPWIEPDDPDLDEQRSRALWEASPHMQEWKDLCWRVQTDLEDALLERARWLHAKTGARRLVIAGGVGLNCVANARIATEGPFEEVWVQPAAGDSGIALGCALYGDLAVLAQPRAYRMGSDALGVTYADDDLDAALAFPLIRSIVSATRVDDVARETARILAEGAVVGWFQGGAELGPRALGQRSILCDPRDPCAKERLNARVKHRQAFRPFAPVVPEELADEWFEPGPPSTHMLFVRRIRRDRVDRIPAVAHVDGTARLQTVVRGHRPELHALLLAFGELTGVPVLVNTSFNVRGEPMVETPVDALLCFLGTDMDALVLHDRILRKRRWSRGLCATVASLYEEHLRKRDPGFRGSPKHRRRKPG